MKLVARIIVALLVVVLVLYVGGMAYLYVEQRSFEYAPGDMVRTLGETRLTTAEAVAIPTAGGAVINGWYEAPQPGEPIIVYYHGN
ncbi:MAG TPA: hypothetical protein VHZ56_03890, partial [Devosia sp.]|nr:hypothetical protein [Devosia sp.]